MNDCTPKHRRVKPAGSGRRRRGDSSVGAPGLRELQARQRKLERQNEALRKTVAAMRDSETLFRTLADSEPALVWIIGTDERCSWVNHYMLEFTGRQLEQEVGEGWADNVHPDDLDYVLRSYRAAVSRRQRFEQQYRLRRADGQYRWLLNRGLPHFGNDGTFLGFVGSATDITRIKRIEEDLTLAQSVGRLGSWRYNPLRKVYSGSREVSRILNVAPDKVMRFEDVVECVHPEDRAEFLHRWLGAQSGIPFSAEHRMIVNGNIRWVHHKVELGFAADGNQISGFGIVQDITEIKQAQQSLAETQERFSAFMNHAPMASWIVDAEGVFQYVSESFFTTFHVDFTNPVGKRMEEVFAPERAERYLRVNEATLRSWRATQTVHKGFKPDGTPGEFMVIRFPLRDAFGQPMVGGLGLDITERHLALNQLHEANARLEGIAAEQARHLRELASRLTQAEQHERDRLYERLHDDMQPLLVSARLSLSSLGAHTPKDDCLRVAAQACEHLGQVLQTARTLSRQLSPPLVRERGLAPALISLCGWMKDNHGLEVELHCAEDAEPEDVTIRLLCFNAVRELLTNVVKHAGTPGVRLSVHPLQDDQRLRITVADGGHGFDPAATRSGTGLAAIERRLSMVGGSLQVESGPGLGTSVTLWAPLSPVPAAAARVSL